MGLDYESGRTATVPPPTPLYLKTGPGHVNKAISPYRRAAEGTRVVGALGMVSQSRRVDATCKPRWGDFVRTGGGRTSPLRNDHVKMGGLYPFRTPLFVLKRWRVKEKRTKRASRLHGRAHKSGQDAETGADGT